MTLLWILIPSGFPQVHHRQGVGFIHKFVERFAVPQADPGIDSRENSFGASYEADMLQNNRLKNDYLISVTFLTSYVVEFHRKCQDKNFTNPDR